jgi:hypothetical protein
MGLSFVFPLHDATGAILARYEPIWPVLETVADRAYVGITSVTQARSPDAIEKLARNSFVEVVSISDQAPVGDQFSGLYRSAANRADGDQVLHLCFSDRLAFAIESSHREHFLADVAGTADCAVPLIFARSEYAWSTHPRNYRDIEEFVTTLGEHLFGRRLDFGWCHLVLQARRLAEVALQVRNHDLSVVSEFVLAVRDEVEMKDVDWLEWEDPHDLGRDARELRRERETSVAEVQKRLGYTIPMMQTLLRAARGESPPAAG